MVATIVNYTRGGVNTPGLDAGTFSAPSAFSGNDILIISKMRNPIALIVTELISAGQAGQTAFYAPTQSAGLAFGSGQGVSNLGRAPAVGVFSTTQSSGAWIPNSELAPGQSYQWICAGL